MKTASILLLAVTVSLCAVNERNEETAKKSGSSSFQPKPLDDDWSKWLVGEWEGLSKSDVGTGRIRMKIDFGLNGQFLIMKTEAMTTEITDEQRQYLRETLHASDEEIERFQTSTFKELQIHTIDPKTGERLGYLFDSMRCIATGTGRLEGNRERMEWVWSAFAQGATSVSSIEKISNNKFTANMKYTLPNGNKMEEKMGMIRKKIETDK